MTFKELKKRVILANTIQQQSKLFEICKGKPFWIWDIKEHKLQDTKTKGSCYFNHTLGLSTKDAIERHYTIPH